jgi:hypothetical protein
MLRKLRWHKRTGYNFIQNLFPKIGVHDMNDYSISMKRSGIATTWKNVLLTSLIWLMHS